MVDTQIEVASLSSDVEAKANQVDKSKFPDVDFDAIERPPVTTLDKEGEAGLAELGQIRQQLNKAAAERVQERLRAYSTEIPRQSGFNVDWSSLQMVKVPNEKGLLSRVFQGKDINLVLVDRILDDGSFETYVQVGKQDFGSSELQQDQADSLSGDDDFQVEVTDLPTYDVPIEDGTEISYGVQIESKMFARIQERARTIPGYKPVSSGKMRGIWAPVSAIKSSAVREAIMPLQPQTSQVA